MKLTDFALTPQQQLQEVNRYLKESFGYTINQDKYDQAKISRALAQLKQQQREISSSVRGYQHDPSYTKSVMIAESLKLLGRRAQRPRAISESTSRLRLLLEQDLAQAEVALAAKSMAEDIQDMAEKVAKMQVETLMSLVDTMKETHGTAAAEQFNTAADAALEQLLELLKTTHDALSNAAGVVAGEEQAAMIPSPAAGGEAGAEAPAGGPAPEEFAAPEPAAPNEFAGAAAASGPAEEPSGRELK